MYLPNSFKEEDLPTLHKLIEEASFGAVITVEDGQPVVSHLPFYLETGRGKFGTLLGHMARANKQWKTFQPDQELLVIFQGPHTYISPSWYDQSSGTSVPTWNFAVVHAYGLPRLIEDFDAKHQLLQDEVDTFEAGFAHPWKMELPHDYERKQMAAIVAFEIEITRLEGKFKLSQNRPEIDRPRVMQALEDSASAEDQKVAALMREKYRS